MFSDDEEHEEDDDDENEDEVDDVNATPVKETRRKRVVKNGASGTEASQPNLSTTEDTSTGKKKKQPTKRKKTTATPVSKKTKAVRHISLIDNPSDEDDIIELSENPEDVDDPEETTTEKKRRITASRLPVSTCTLRKEHCLCSEFNGCCGCGKMINITQTNNPADLACILYADRICHLSSHYKHRCPECDDTITNNDVVDDNFVNDVEGDTWHLCPFPFCGSHCGCTPCCGCSLFGPENQTCQGNGARICDFSSYHGHVCPQCYDYCCDKQLC